MEEKGGFLWNFSNRKAQRCLQNMNIITGYEYPVIVREGTNDLGKTVWYFLNYSAKEQSVAYKYSDGEDVLTGETIKAESQLIIPAWDVWIVEV